MSGRVVRRTVEGIPPEVVTPVEERIDHEDGGNTVEPDHRITFLYVLTVVIVVGLFLAAMIVGSR